MITSVACNEAARPLTRKHKLFVFLTGMVVFSSLCSYITVKLMHLPCLVELFLIPLAYIYRGSYRISQNSIIGIALFIFCGTFLGGLCKLYTIADIVPIARCFALGAIGFVLAKDNNIFRNIDTLYIFCFGVFMGDLLNAYMTMNDTIAIRADKQYSIDINIIFAVLWPMLTILYKDKRAVFFVFCIVPVLCFISASRGVSTFFILGIILAYCIKLYKRPSEIIFAAAILCAFGIFLYTLYESSEDAVRSYSPAMHFRLYTKMDSYGTNVGDTKRIDDYVWAIQHFSFYALPHGFLGKTFQRTMTGDNIPYMAPWDSTYMEMFYTFGIPLFGVLFFIYVARLLKCFEFFRKTGNYVFGCSAALLTLLFVEFIFTYGLVRSPFMVFCNGAFLGYIWRITSHPSTLYGNLIQSDSKPICLK